ncbi:MAG: putative lipid II flippase FtsW [Nitrospirae bacterium]|nr:putative lipid II flippase FtsW [Nitrospirota bacterium]
MARRDRVSDWLATIEAVDRPLVIVVALLLVGSVVMVYSASSAVAMERYDDAGYFLKRQLLWVGVGVLAMAVTAQMNVWGWQRLALPLLLLSAALLALVLLPSIGTTVNGARRWLRLSGWSVQPSELAKLAVICYLARYLAAHADRIAEFRRGVLPPLIICGALVMLVLAEPDFGTASVIAILTLLLLFVGQVRLSHLGALALAAAPAAALLIASSPYRRQRFLAFLNPWENAQTSGFQIVQSLLAMGRGGVGGLGLGESRQKLFFLPEPHTDFIFSVIGEELGLIGTVVVLALFLVFFWRGLVIAQRAEEPFLRYLAVGITAMIGVQALLHMAVVIGLLPTKGLTLPLLSYGGSSLVVDLAAVGILLAICRQRAAG